MITNRISIAARISLVCAGLALIAVLFYPLWRIDLDAPQYPEGLMLLIYPDKLAGNVDIINGLNHYIGMKTLHADDFPEFKILPYIIMFFIGAFILTGIIGRRKLLYLLCFLFVLFGIVAMYDFWRWEYDYGHNLDPNAAIIVPGMAYQPPLIGFKQLLNFGAYSMPDVGGWIFVGAGVIVLLFTIFEWNKVRKNKRTVTKSRVAATAVMALLISGCNVEVEPINVGKDACHFCKMTISDKKFGAEVISDKGKIFKFDDTHCLGTFLKSGTLKPEQVSGTYVTDFVAPNNLIEKDKAFFIHNEDMRSPMGGNIATFSSEAAMNNYLSKSPGVQVTWKEVIK